MADFTKYPRLLALHALCAFGLSAGACAANPGSWPESPASGGLTAEIGQAEQAGTGHAAKTDGTPEAPGSYSLAWEAETGNWNHAIAVAPWGDVVSLGMWQLAVHARDNGKVLSSTKLCGALRAGSFGFTNDRTAVLACKNELQQITFPTLAAHTLLTFPWDAEDAAVRAGLVAVANEKGPVLVYRIEGLKQLDSFDAGGPVKSVAIKPDGTAVAIGLDSGQIELRDLTSHQLRQVHKGSTDVTALEFSPNGKQLFAEVASFTGGVVDVEQGTLDRSYHLSSWIQAARFVSPKLVAATGAHGLALLDADGLIKSLLEETAEGLAVSPDGTLVCSGDRDGKLSCFSSKKLAPSAWRTLGPGTDTTPSAAPGGTVAPSGTAATSPAPGSTSAPPPSPPAPAAPAVEVLGQIQSHVGKQLWMSSGAAGGAKVGAKGELSRHIAQDLGGLSFSGWLVVASVTVTKVEAGRVQLQIDQEQSSVTINQKKVDHFKPGTEVKLALTP